MIYFSLTFPHVFNHKSGLSDCPCIDGHINKLDGTRILLDHPKHNEYPPKEKQVGWLNNPSNCEIYIYIEYLLYIYTYTYIHIYIYTYIHIYICTYIHRYVYTYIHIYIYTYIHIYYIHIYIYTYLHIYIYTYICIYHIYTYTYTHIYIYIEYIYIYNLELYVKPNNAREHLQPIDRPFCFFVQSI